ncbi:MAG: helix-turn-helix transcriptional regulator [Comamonas sp.]
MQSKHAVRKPRLRKRKLQLQLFKYCVRLYGNTGVYMSKDQKKLLGSRLRAARIAAKQSQDFSAEVLGVTRQSVSAWETGVSTPSALQLGQLAVAYCSCAHTLLFGEPFTAVELRELLSLDAEKRPSRNLV